CQLPLPSTSATRLPWGRSYEAMPSLLPATATERYVPKTSGTVSTTPFVLTHLALLSRVTHALPAPPQSAGVQPPTVVSQRPRSLVHAWAGLQLATRQGLSSTTAASSKRKSPGSAGTSTLARASETFERVLPPAPGSITRNAMTGLPSTRTILL